MDVDGTEILYKKRTNIKDNFEGQPEVMVVSCLYKGIEKRSGKSE